MNKKILLLSPTLVACLLAVAVAQTLLAKNTQQPAPAQSKTQIEEKNPAKNRQEPIDLVPPPFLNK